MTHREYWEETIQQLQREYDNAVRLSFQDRDYLAQAEMIKAQIKNIKDYIIVEEQGQLSLSY